MAIGGGWSGYDVPASAVNAWARGIPAATVLRAAGMDTHPGGEQLKHYWIYGKGRAKWETFTELLRHLRKHNVPHAKAAAAEWFHERHGYWPGADINRVRHGKKPRGQKVGPG